MPVTLEVYIVGGFYVSVTLEFYSGRNLDPSNVYLNSILLR